MSKWPMRGHFWYLRFKTFPLTPRTPQCEVFWSLLSNSKHSGVLEDSKSPTFGSVGLHPHTSPKWGCDTHPPIHLLIYPFAHLPTYLPTFYFLFFITYSLATYHPTTCYLPHNLVGIWNKHVKLKTWSKLDTFWCCSPLVRT
jgi:hypothetical protein